jgi:hypothetical protein
MFAFSGRTSVSGMAPFRVLEVARAVADETNKLLGNRRLRLLHRAQLRDSAQSIPANIREGMGRKPGLHRSPFTLFFTFHAAETRPFTLFFTFHFTLLFTCHFTPPSRLPRAEVRRGEGVKTGVK